VAGVERQGGELRRNLIDIRRQREEVQHQPLLRALDRVAPGDRLELDQEALKLLTPLQDLRQLLVLAELLISAALFRQESRGGHHRTDAPAAQPFWQRHTVQQRDRAIRTVALGTDGRIRTCADP
jgi:L-aspartate oxidase